jgi:hypothetical protein
MKMSRNAAPLTSVCIDKAVTFLSITPPGLFQIFGRIIGNVSSSGFQPQLNLDDGRVGQGWVRPKGIYIRLDG